MIELLGEDPISFLTGSTSLSQRGREMKKWQDRSEGKSKNALPVVVSLRSIIVDRTEQIYKRVS